MEEKEKRKILISSIIIIITLILVAIGTTYAFFSLQIEGEETTTNVEITTGEQNEITLSGGITNYHIKLDVSDMTEDKIWTYYYGTTDSTKNYETDEDLAFQDIGTLTKKGTLTEKYICSADINISLDGDMQEFLQANDLVLVVKQGSTINTYDLSNISTKNIFRFKLDNDHIEPIQAFLVFTNQKSDQSDLAGTSLNISINIDNFACEIPHPNLALLLEKGGDTFKEQSGMYRFIGTNEEVTNNYICFGTDDTEKCLDTPEDYMYRIIGVTNEDDNTINLPANSLKIIKAVPSSTEQIWNSKYTSSECIVDGIDKCTWDDSDMKKYLNETFLPDAISKWENGTTWDSIILNHSWYNVDQPEPFMLREEPKTSHTNESKIGLMYETDFMLFGRWSDEGWLYLINGVEKLMPQVETVAIDACSGEWTMTRYGSSVYGEYKAWVAGEKHYKGYFWEKCSVRPVFYISPDVTLTGEGNAESPFIIHS